MNETSFDAMAISAGHRVEVSLLLDSGQMYTCLPQAVWRELGLTAKRRLPLARDDGSFREVHVGECLIESDLGSVTTPVILGEPGDLPILGTLTLAELGYLLDPLSREIVPAVLRLHAISAEVGSAASVADR